MSEHNDRKEGENNLDVSKKQIPKRKGKTQIKSVKFRNNVTVERHKVIEKKALHGPQPH